MLLVTSDFYGGYKCVHRGYTCLGFLKDEVLFLEIYRFD